MRIEAVDYVRDTIGEEMRSLCSESQLDTGRIGDVSVAVSRIWDKIYSKSDPGSRYERNPDSAIIAQCLVMTFLGERCTPG